MNTPTHLVVGLLCVPNRRDDLLLFSAIIIGAILPDAPMFLFYGIEKFAFETPENIIWSQKYYDPRWQNFFDAFNSIPLIALGMLAAYASRMPRLLALFVSMLLHTLCDLPVHHDDGHRHFWPLSDWRFESPVSYWDSAHYGNWFLVFEFVLMIVATVWLIRRTKRTGLRIAYGAITLIYLVFVVFAIVHWGALVH